MDFIFSLVFCLILLLVIYIPYIIFIGTFAMIIWIITTEKIASKILKTLIIIVILLYGTIIIGNFKSAKPDEQYIKMNEINDNQSLIGLSKEQVVELLGKPDWAEDERTYYYDAGKVTDYLLFGLRDSYELRIVFDENYIVISTSIRKVA